MLKRTRHIGIFTTGLTLAWIWLLATSCQLNSYQGKIVMVQAPADESESGSHFGLLDPAKEEVQPLLAEDKFFMVGSPDVSFDGERLLFEAKQNSNDKWQIWELYLKESDLKQITGADSDCRYPAYLPDGRIVYSRYVQDGATAGYHVLETSDLSGDEKRQITFDPVDYSNSMVLRDGRLLVTAKQIHPFEEETQLMVMRPDGTKKELFYGAEGHLIQAHGASETGEGLIVFSESKQEETGGKLVSVRYNSPSNSKEELAPGSFGDFSSVNPGFSGELMISFRIKPGNSYDLYSYDAGLDKALKPLFSDPEINTLDAKALAPRERPKKLPSAVDLEKHTALLLCQDANFTGRAMNGSDRKAVRVELLGLHGSLGQADLEEDGSVYLKVAADVPFRMQTLDEEGSLVQGPSSWINLRPNERRGCVGCHAGSERAPFNRQPLAVQKAPVEISKYSEAIMADALKTDLTHE